MRAAVVAIALLGGAACDQTQPARVSIEADTTAGEVAFELAGAGGAALVVPVHINGTGPHSFVLDTGATITCMRTDLAEQLELPEVSGVLGMGAGVGSSGRVRLVSVDSLRLGGILAEELQACVLDFEHLTSIGLEIDGLLGLNVLRQFRVTLDFDRSIVTFERPGTDND
jgi:predicted aspartyl protease